MSVEKGKICDLELFFLMTAFVQGSLLLIDFTVSLTEHQTWMVILAGLAVSLPFVLSYAALSKRFPGMNVVARNICSSAG